MIDLFEATPLRANFLTAVAFSKKRGISPSREQKNVAVFTNGFNWRKSLHSQNSPRWAQQTYATKEKNCDSECYKKVLYAGPKLARNILAKLSPNPARPEKQSLHSPSLCTYSKKETALNVTYMFRWEICTSPRQSFFQSETARASNNCVVQENIV